MNQGTNLGSQIGRWIILAAVVALLGALLLTIRPVGATEAPPSLDNADTVHDYAENDTGPITTFRATDPENLPVFWTLGGSDAADFTIAGGVLRFKSPPNYEVPRDRDERAGTTTGPAKGVFDNIYKVTVRFGAGGEYGMGGTDAYDGDDLGEIGLTVNVTNVNEPGMLVISPMQPQVGTELTAILTDKDNVAPGAGEWQWARSESMTGTFTDIPALSKGMTYSPTIDDLDMYLRVTVVYVDRAGSESRTLAKVLAVEVRKDTVTSNQPPKYPDQKTLVGGNAIAREDTDRFIPETAKAGDLVGAPVTAFDDKTDIEKLLTYSLLDATAQVTNDGDAASFDIDAVTGQITVGAMAMLDADATGATNPYNVVVRAVDGDGDVQDIDVTIGVLQVGEPPRIDRVYATGRVPTGVEVEVGDRAPTEMTHYELDRNNTPATVIDTNLDTVRTTTLEPATYYATDPDADPTFTWSLEGDDVTRMVDGDEVPIFVIDADPNTEGVQSMGPSATLAFADESRPNFETPWDANKDNVYEVTIVVKDGTVDIEGVPHMDELEVTVKVINSTEDNRPGSVAFSNRQPEVATALTATLTDKDTPTREVKWQWYRAAGADGTVVCGNRTPAADDPAADDPTAVDTVNQRRHYVETDTPDSAWVMIAGATSASYTPKAVLNDDGTPNEDETDVSKCLRATVTYRDAGDRTHSGPDDNSTTVDETLEATWEATEQPVKVIDEHNDAPVFLDTDDNPTSTYRADVAENSLATPIMVGKSLDTLFATDLPAEEDDSENDLLTYSLSGRDASSFSIVGSVGNPTPDAAADDGTLTINPLSMPGYLNYEGQREYRVIITATDPSGDSDSVNVIVNLTNLNEMPTWTEGNTRVVYAENGTADVDIYRAADPEGSGITYSLVDAEADPITTDDIADRALFEIRDVGGNLSFKASPNYEDAKDAGTNNMYQVTVRATVADDFDPRHTIEREVTVIVSNVNEAPVFSKTTDALEIKENPDDPEKEPPSTADYEYLLNRGVGIPGTNLPADPNLDVGIPLVAVDDDNSGPEITPALTGIATPRQLIDGLTYELSGADAGPFDIVPATGQILTLEKLDYEIKNEYKVTVKATDPMGLYDMIDVTINVTNVDEVPVPDILRITGDDSHTYEENGTEAVGEYTVAAGGEATPGAWTLKGADASGFTLTGSGNTRMLAFRSSPDYDAMADADGDNMYEVTLKVTDSSNRDTYDTFPVTVTVTNVDELGALSGSETASIMEGDTDALGTYTLTAIEDGPTVTWSLGGTDMSDFMLEGTGMSRMLKFGSAPDYESPMGGADNDSNTYMVTVMADAGGEMEMVEVTVMVDNAVELGTLSGPESASNPEGMDAVGTYMASGTMADTATWTLDGDDASQFMLDMVEGSDMSRMLKFSSAPDYENPMGGADNDSNTYMVIVKAEAGGEMKMTKVITVAVTDVVELGMLTADMVSPISYMENGTMPVATYMADGPMADNAMWTLMGDDAEDFNIGGGQLTFKASPNHEDPVDANTDNTYMVTVKASAGGEMAMQAVTVAVTDVVELGMLTADMVSPISYMENDDGAVATYTAADSTADNAKWTLMGDDAGDFMLEPTTGMSSMLKFRNSPNYEMPRGMAMSATNKNTYMVTVKAEAGGEMKMMPVTVTVTNEDEDGTVTLEPMPYRVGTEITATLADDDIGPGTTVAWQWSRSMTMDGTYMDFDTATSKTYKTSYTPVGADKGYYLRATASYTDGFGSGKTVMATTASTVTAANPLLAKYDTNPKDGRIDYGEAVAAILSYRSGGAEGASYSEAVAVLLLYRGS